MRFETFISTEERVAMTENEALESALKKIIAQEKSNWGYIENFDVDENWAVRTAIEQVQQYRKIGTVEECREVVEKQPTAYDPDKVVKQLEERTAFLKDCTKYGNKTAEQQSKSYDTMMMYEVKNLVDDLLEIVKGGGVDGN